MIYQWEKSSKNCHLVWYVPVCKCPTTPALPYVLTIYILHIRFRVSGLVNWKLCCSWTIGGKIMVAEVDSSFKFFGFLAGNLIVNASKNCLKTNNQAGIYKDFFIIIPYHCWQADKIKANFHWIKFFIKKLGNLIDFWVC